VRVVTGLLDHGLAVGLVALVALVSAGFGFVVLRRFGYVFRCRAEAVAVSTGTGLAVLIHGVLVLASLGSLSRAAAWGLLAVLAVPGWRAVASAWSDRRRLPRLAIGSGSWLERVMIGACALFAFAYLLVGLAPTLEGDSLAGYLVLARQYAERGTLAPGDHAYGTAYPQGGQALAALGFLLHGQIAAQLLVVWLPGVLTLVAIYAFGRLWVSRRAAWVGMAVWYGMPSVAYLAASAKVDIAWAALDLLAVVAFSRWYFGEPERAHRRWLILAGLLLGAAGGIKQTSAFTALVLAVAIAARLWQVEERAPRAWVASFLSFSLPATTAIAWVWRTYRLTGSPAAVEAGVREATGPAGFLGTVWQMSMLGNAWSVEGPLGKSIGPTILATVPLLLLTPARDRRLWSVLAFCALMVVLWFHGVQRARHLLPTLALLTLVAGRAVTAVLASRPRLGRLVVALALISLTVNLGAWGYVNFVSLDRLRYVLGLQDLDGYLAANLPRLPWYPNYAVVVYARTYLPSDARIAALSSRNSYYLDRPLYATWSQTPAQVPNPTAFLGQLQTAGITHVFTNDHVIKTRGLQDAWLLQPGFQVRYLEPLMCADGQCLFRVAAR
jgi:4-amino-4-deoxy-L-arabinose transferase-like glycosyltransferase